MSIVNFEGVLGQFIGGLLVLLSIATGLISVGAVLNGAWIGFFIAGIVAIVLFKFGSSIWKEQSQRAK
ncbi:MAG: hypothetical protein ACP5OU_09830 [Methanothrix sp.]